MYLQEIIEFIQKNLYKRIYTKEVIEDFNDNTYLIIGESFTPANDMRKILHHAIAEDRVKGELLKLEQNENGDCLYEIKVWDKNIHEILENGFSIFPRGQGELIKNDDGTYSIDKYELISLGICEKKDNAVIGNDE
jgi:hypothetical protein